MKQNELYFRVGYDTKFKSTAFHNIKFQTTLTSARVAGERGVSKCQHYNISSCRKLVNEGGGAGIKNPQHLVNVVYEYPLT